VNVVPLEPALPEGLRRQLGALPVFEPPSRLREQVLGVALRRPARRRLPLATAAGLVAATALVSTLVWRGTGAPGVPSPAMGRVAALEGELHGLRLVAAGAPAAAALEAELSRIDRALQAAYDAGEASPRIEGLWRDRERLLDDLVLAYRQPDRVIRI
jgi:hypothetical protein